MIQAKCGKCGMVCNINEVTFVNRFDDEGRAKRTFHCVSCGSEIPPYFVDHIYHTIREECFFGWKIGTMFSEKE